MGVPLDDTWIHFRYAENFANGHFIEYNINEPTPGTTSPLWVIILTLAFLLKIDPVYYSLAAGSIFFLLACTEVYKICLRLNFEKLSALMTALLTLLSGRLIWSSLSGMEITLFCYLILLATRIHLDEYRNKKLSAVTGLLLGLASITRPEAVLLALIYYFVSFVLLKNEIKNNPSKPGFTSLNKRNFALSIVLFLLLVIPYPVFSYIHTGGVLPNTFRAQGGGLRFIPDIDFLRETGKLFFRDNLIIFLLWFATAIIFVNQLLKKRIEKEFLLINMWIILLPAISSVVGPNWRHHGRYLIPVIPFVIIASLRAAEKIYSYIKTKGSTKLPLIRNAFIVLIFLLTFVSTVVYARALGWNVENINDQQVKIAYWLKQNLPDEKALGLNDIGAIIYITKKRTVDMEGLITPEVFGFRKLSESQAAEEMLKLLRQNGVNYIVIYPEWFSYLVEKYSAALEKVHSVYLENNTICGGDEMFVYKIHWDRVNK
jgi:arabinofuranosyltransferase